MSNNVSFLTKRIIILCAFFMFSCSQEHTSNSESSNNALSDKQQNASQGMDSEPQALLTLNEILNASDVKQALAIAAKTGDEEILRYWQKEILKVADEVNLLDSERRLLEGEQGISFLSFQGMKTNYQRDFEAAFVEFEDLDAVYEKYPAFENLHQQSKELVAKRDILIQKVADELKTQGYEGDVVAEAKRQWQVYIRANQQ